MKKLYFISGLILVLSYFTGFSASAKSAPSIVGIDITFCTKAFWSGEQQTCLPREHGCCLHIGIEVLAPGSVHGTISKDKNNDLLFIFSKKTGILPATFNELCRNNMFLVDGDGTFSSDLLKQLSLPADYRIRSGSYPYTEEDGNIIVRFK